ncbi:MULTISPECIES: WzyE family oligosaccharide polymerase [Glaesserella]|uniref:O-antigen assembly polymerase n=1 Tax=Glaesserella australis TaxID=2094024 RepID=A0A328BZ17_9PAST|nr:MULTISPECIES: WzyE family oligosaccharide polymerase [Glaesserella]AUI67023.1 O-antigen assembly polymerase [Glaesserella sp. 15-184]RAL18885.1 O-antigen assembly polymerase [Glaesserella australis]
MAELSGVVLCYLMMTIIMGYFLYRIYQQQFFSFHLLFSGIYFITFFLGFPFSLILSLYFAHPLPSTTEMLITFATAFISYLWYLLCYRLCAFKTSVSNGHTLKQTELAKFQANLTACILCLLAFITLAVFIYLNDGLLFFTLEKYSQIFSSEIKGIPLKRFFYFFIPALLIWFLLSPTKKRWWLFLIVGMGFGGLSYLAVGGTRANMATVFFLFIILGFYFRYISLKWILITGIGAVGVMSVLAFIRYNLNLQGMEILHTLLYLTRDTFSPWQNLSKILSTEIDFLGLMPIVRDFYVYIPTSLWQERPDIVWNSANYFTKVLLGNQSGLAISPTLLGSFYIMGGFPMIMLGMAIVGGLIRMADYFFVSSQNTILVQSFCLANVFNLIVLVREGMDAFVSRFCFFSMIFLCAYTMAWVISKMRVKNG